MNKNGKVVSFVATIWSTFYHAADRVLLQPFCSFRGAYDRRQSRFLAGLILVLLVLGVVNEISYTYTEYSNGYRGFTIVFTCLFAVWLLYLAARTRHYRKIGIVFILLVSALVYFVNLISQMPDISFLIFLCLPIIMAGYFFSVRVMALIIVMDIVPIPILYLIFPQFHLQLEASSNNNSILPGIIFIALISLVLTRHRNLLEKDIIAEATAQETRFRRLLEQTFEANCTVIRNTIRHANEKFLQMFGYSVAELEHISLRQLFLEQDLQPPESFQPGQIHEMHALRKDGTRFFAEIIIYSDQEKTEQGWLLAIRDITARKNVEELLQQANTEKEQLLEAMTAIIIRVDPRGHIMYWNRPTEQATGVLSSEALGNEIGALPIQWDRDNLLTAIAKCQSLCERTPLAEMIVTLPDGNKRILGITANPITQPQSNQTEVLLLGSDITEKTIIEQQLEQKNKLEAIGQLAAGVAHEINNPIQFISSNLRYLNEHYSDLQLMNLQDPAFTALPKVAREKVDKIRADYPNAIQQSISGVERIIRIVSALRNFSHPGTGDRVLSNLNRGLESTVEVSRNEWKHIAEVELKLDPDLPVIECNPGEINQVFLNIIINASHAIKDASGWNPSTLGHILITSSHTDQFVDIRISDSGTGIPDHIRQRVFDPFFTTKEVGRGTGQGLAISHNIIVNKHKGRLYFESEEGKGTTFIIQLPIHPPRS
jgi:PAS domain S-box-containing protein